MSTTTLSKKPPISTAKLSFKHGIVELAHGSGGRASAALIEQCFKRAFSNPILLQGDDSARLSMPTGEMVMTTDSYVVSPLFFPGGNIGDLAINGTINDLAMLGAKPLYISAGFILEAGFALSKLRTIVETMAVCAKNANVNIVTGDTKVVEKGKGDGIFINTTGIGVIPSCQHECIQISGMHAKVGDKVILSGEMGYHGMAVMAQRHGLSFTQPCISDTKPLHDLVQTMLTVSTDIHCLRDPTRGGVATTLNELATQSCVGICVDESAVLVRDDVRSACELLGLDPFYLANEGLLIAICAPNSADAMIHAMQQHPFARKAAVIGEVIADPDCFVRLQTQLGGIRVMDVLTGEQLPRIC